MPACCDDTRTACTQPHTSHWLCQLSKTARQLGLHHPIKNFQHSPPAGVWIQPEKVGEDLSQPVRELGVLGLNLIPFSLGHPQPVPQVLPLPLLRVQSLHCCQEVGWSQGWREGKRTHQCLILCITAEHRLCVECWVNLHKE